MFAEEIERPFDSIDSAHDYMDIVATTTLEALSELKRDRDQALQDGELRHAQAIDLAIFKLKTEVTPVGRLATAPAAPAETARCRWGQWRSPGRGR